MQALIALLPQLISLIPTAVVGVNQLVAWISSIRQATQQTGEWTPELEAAYIAALEARAKLPQYQPDAP